MHKGKKSVNVIAFYVSVASERHKRWNIYTALVPEVICYHLANYITKDWKMLGRQLIISESVLQSIDHEHNSVQDRCIAMLIIWRQKFGREATVEVLTEALKRIGRKDLSGMNISKDWQRLENAGQVASVFLLKLA